MKRVEKSTLLRFIEYAQRTHERANLSPMPVDISSLDAKSLETEEGYAHIKAVFEQATKQICRELLIQAVGAKAFSLLPESVRKMVEPALVDLAHAVLQGQDLDASAFTQAIKESFRQQGAQMMRGLDELKGDKYTLKERAALAVLRQQARSTGDILPVSQKASEWKRQARRSQLALQDVFAHGMIAEVELRFYMYTHTPSNVREIITLACTYRAGLACLIKRSPVAATLAYKLGVFPGFDRDNAQAFEDFILAKDETQICNALKATHRGPFMECASSLFHQIDPESFPRDAKGRRAFYALRQHDRLHYFDSPQFAFLHAYADAFYWRALFVLAAMHTRPSVEEGERIWRGLPQVQSTFAALEDLLENNFIPFNKGSVLNPLMESGALVCAQCFQRSVLLGSPYALSESMQIRLDATGLRDGKESFAPIAGKQGGIDEIIHSFKGGSAGVLNLRRVGQMLAEAVNLDASESEGRHVVPLDLGTAFVYLHRFFAINSPVLGVWLDCSGEDEASRKKSIHAAESILNDWLDEHLDGAGGHAIPVHQGVFFLVELTQQQKEKAEGLEGPLTALLVSFPKTKTSQKAAILLDGLEHCAPVAYGPLMESLELLDEAENRLAEGGKKPIPYAVPIWIAEKLGPQNAAESHFDPSKGMHSLFGRFNEAKPIGKQGFVFTQFFRTAEHWRKVQPRSARFLQWHADVYATVEKARAENGLFSSTHCTEFAQVACTAGNPSSTKHDKQDAEVYLLGHSGWCSGSVPMFTARCLCNFNLEETLAFAGAHTIFKRNAIPAWGEVQKKAMDFHKEALSTAPVEVFESTELPADYTQQRLDEMIANLDTNTPAN